MNVACKRTLVALALVLSAVGAVCAAAPVQAPNQDTYAAIVFSPNGQYGYASNFTVKDEAVNAAKEQCKATGNLVAVWAKNGYVALAIGENDIVEAASGATKADAEKNALQECKDGGGVNPTIVICISADGD